MVASHGCLLFQDLRCVNHVLLLSLVTTMIMIEVVRATSKELEVHGSPELGYYVSLALGGTKDQVVSVFVMFVNINTNQSNYSSTSWWTQGVLTLLLQE